MKIQKILVLIALVVAIMGCIEIGNMPDPHLTNLKEKHDYKILKFQGASIFYSDAALIKTVEVSDIRYIIQSDNNKTYLHYEKYGGLSDFSEWTLYVSGGADDRI